MKVNRIVAVLAIVALAGAGAALAQAANHAQLSKPTFLHGREGDIYSHKTVLPGGDGPPVPLPTPVDPVANASISQSKSGPMALSSSPVEVGDGLGGLMTPRGGAISTPKQQADREIRRLIRRLD